MKGDGKDRLPKGSGAGSKTDLPEGDWMGVARVQDGQGVEAPSRSPRPQGVVSASLRPLSLALLMVLGVLAPLAAQGPAARQRRTGSRRVVPDPPSAAARQAPAVPARMERGRRAPDRRSDPLKGAASTGRLRPPGQGGVGKAAPGAAPASPADPLGRADAQFRSGAFATALAAYQALLEAQAVPQDRVPEVQLRISRCLGRLARWQAALSTSEDLVRRHPNSAWEARTRVWRMELFLRLPGRVWQVGARTAYGDDALLEGFEANEAVTPTLRDAAAEHCARAVQEGQAALALMGRAGFPGQADLCADLAPAVERLEATTGAPTTAAPSELAFPEELPAELQPEWSPARKMHYLLLRAEQSAEARAKPAARLLRAEWLRRTGVRAAADNRIPREVSAPDVLLTLAADFPDHPLAGRARLLAAAWLERDGRASDALAAIIPLAAAPMDTPGAAAARAIETRLTRPELFLPAARPRLPSTRPGVELSLRNVARVRFEARRVALDEMVAAGRLPTAGSGIAAPTGNLDAFFRGEPIRWEFEPASVPASGDKLPVSADADPRALRRWVAPVPFSRPGAYLITASADGLSGTTLLVISDLAAVQVSGAAGGLVWVVNAGTGTPVARAQVLVRTRTLGVDGRPAERTVSLATDAEGRAQYPASGGARVLNHTCFAWKAERYALAFGSSPAPAIPSVRLFCDRSIAVPGETIRFLAHFPSEGRAIAGAVTGRLTTEGGATVAATRVALPEQGLASGALILPLTAPHGALILTLRDATGRTELARADLRIEARATRELRIAIVPQRASNGASPSTRVRVSDASGMPAAGARLLVRFHDPDGHAGTASPYPPVLVRADAQGEVRVRVPGVIAGSPGTAPAARTISALIVARDTLGRQGTAQVRLPLAAGDGAAAPALGPREALSLGAASRERPGVPARGSVEATGEPGEVTPPWARFHLTETGEVQLDVVSEPQGVPPPTPAVGGRPGGWLIVREGRLRWGATGAGSATGPDPATALRVEWLEGPYGDGSGRARVIGAGGKPVEATIWAALGTGTAPWWSGAERGSIAQAPPAAAFAVTASFAVRFGLADPAIASQTAVPDPWDGSARGNVTRPGTLSASFWRELDSRARDFDLARSGDHGGGRGDHGGTPLRFSESWGSTLPTDAAGEAGILPLQFTAIPGMPHAAGIAEQQYVILRAVAPDGRWGASEAPLPAESGLHVAAPETVMEQEQVPIEAAFRNESAVPLRLRLELETDGDRLRPAAMDDPEEPAARPLHIPRPDRVTAVPAAGSPVPTPPASSDGGRGGSPNGARTPSPRIPPAAETIWRPLASTPWVTIPAGEVYRVRWNVVAGSAGQVRVRVRARAEQEEGGDWDAARTLAVVRPEAGALPDATLAGRTRPRGGTARPVPEAPPSRRQPQPRAGTPPPAFRLTRSLMRLGTTLPAAGRGSASLEQRLSLAPGAALTVGEVLEGEIRLEGTIPAGTVLEETVPTGAMLLDLTADQGSAHWDRGRIRVSLSGPCRLLYRIRMLLPGTRRLLPTLLRRSPGGTVIGRTPEVRWSVVPDGAARSEE